MATAMEAHSMVSDEESCGYCLQRLPYMQDPRLLPCSHLFCLLCLREDVKEDGILKCAVCSRTHEDVELETLPTVENGVGDVNREEEIKTALCDVCNGRKCVSVCYCLQCKKNICEQHHEAHKVFVGSTHSVVFHKQADEVSSKCSVHEDENVVKACSKCLEMLCNSCDSGLSCEAKKGAEDERHELVSLEELAEKLNSPITEALKNISEKITKLCRQEKSVWIDADHIAELVKELAVEVDRVAEKQISDVTKKAKSLKKELRDYLHKVIEETENCTSTLTSQKDFAQKTWNSTRKLSVAGHAGIVQSYQQVRLPRTKSVLSEVPLVHCSERDLLYSSPLPGNLLGIRNLTTLQSKFPSLMKSLGSVQRPDISCAMLTDEFAVGQFNKSGTISSYNKQMLPNDDLTIGRAVIMLTALPLQGFGGYRYLAFLEEKSFLRQQRTQARNYGTKSAGNPSPICLEMTSANFSDRKRIDCFPNTQWDDRRYGVAVHPFTNQIFAVNVHQRHATVYDKDGDYQFDAQVDCSVKANPTEVEILPDGAVILLFEDKSAVGKFEFNSDTKTLHNVWLEETLPFLSDLSHDANGYVYASSRSENCIYVLSNSGVVVGKLFHQNLKNADVSTIQVSGDLIAISTPKEAHLMKLCREK